MARPIKKGLSYFPLDTDFFTGSNDIKVIKSRVGADGIIIYLYCLCEIYKNGYYLQIDEDFYDIMSDDLKMSTDKLHGVMKLLCKRTMLDGNLLTSDNVLTSVGIQERYQEAVKSRALKKPIEVDAKFWLLSEDKTQSFIKVRQNGDLSKNNSNYSKNNHSKSEIKCIKESKEKKSKEKESKDTPLGTFNNVFLTDEEYRKLNDRVINPNRYIERLSTYMQNTGKSYQNHYETIIKWALQDNQLNDESSEGSFMSVPIPEFEQ